MNTFRPHEIPGLRSPYDTVLGLVYFARMLSKIRLHAEGKLPKDYQENLGGGFDARCVTFLKVDYERLKEEVLKGGSDEELLEWCFAQGGRPREDEIEIWNGFMTKRGWRDEGTPVLKRRIQEAGLPDDGKIETMFQFLDVDEGRIGTSQSVD